MTQRTEKEKMMANCTFPQIQNWWQIENMPVNKNGSTKKLIQNQRAVTKRNFRLCDWSNLYRTECPF